nr:Bm1550 [Brugia malayi]
MALSSISMQIDHTNQQNVHKHQNSDSKMRQSIKTTEILPTITDKLNETTEYSNMKHSRNQNERRIRHKEVAGSGVKSLRKLEILRDTIALLLFSFIMF